MLYNGHAFYDTSVGPAPYQNSHTPRPSVQSTPRPPGLCRAPKASHIVIFGAMWHHRCDTDGVRARRWVAVFAERGQVSRVGNDIWWAVRGGAETGGRVTQSRWWRWYTKGGGGVCAKGETQRGCDTDVHALLTFAGAPIPLPKRCRAARFSVNRHRGRR